MPEPTTIRLKCQCGKTYVVKAAFAGKTATCKQCGAQLNIPLAGRSEPSLPPLPPAPASDVSSVNASAASTTTNEEGLSLPTKAIRPDSDAHSEDTVAAKWHYADVQGSSKGPVSRSVLEQLVHGGEINSATLVWKDGMTEWTPISAVPELCEAVSPLSAAAIGSAATAASTAARLKARPIWYFIPKKVWIVYTVCLLALIVFAHKELVEHWIMALCCLFLPPMGILLYYSRIRKIAVWAAEKGLTFRRERDWRFQHEYPGFGCLNKGDNRYAYNIVEGKWSGRPFTAFQYHYTIPKKVEGPSGKKFTYNEPHSFSAVLLDSELALKPLTIEKGSGGLQFEWDEFNHNFRVTGERKWAFDVLNARSMEFLMSMPRLTIEFGKFHVMVHIRHVPPLVKEIENAANLAQGLLERLPEYVRRQQRPERLKYEEERQKMKEKSAEVAGAVEKLLNNPMIVVCALFSRLVGQKRLGGE